MRRQTVLLPEQNRMVIEYEEAIGNIPWLRELKNMDDPESESIITSKSGVNFKFW